MRFRLAEAPLGGNPAIDFYSLLLLQRYTRREHKRGKNRVDARREAIARAREKSRLLFYIRFDRMCVRSNVRAS